MTKLNKLFLLLICFMFTLSPLKASNGITTTSLGHAYRVDQGSHYHREFDFYLIKYQGEIAFCLEPMVYLSLTSTYTPTPFSNWNGLDADTKEKILLALQYGYSFPTHQTDRYYMATQKLIWSYTMATTTFYPNKNSFNGSYSVEQEEKEIKRLISLANIKPDFDQQVYQLDDNQQVEISDTSESGKDFVIDTISDNLECTYQNGKLKVTSLDGQGGDITFIKGHKVDTVKTIQTATSSDQDIIIVNENSFSATYAKVTIVPKTTGKIEIIKKDAVTKETIPQAGITFTLTNSKAEKIINPQRNDEYFEMDNTGCLAINDLPLDTYQLTEVKSPAGYLLNQTPLTFVLSNDSPTQVIEFFNQPIKGQINLHKTEKSLTRNSISIANARYQLLTPTGTLVAEGYTDEKGIIEFKNLDLGKYILQEVEAPQGYLVDQTIYHLELTATDNKTSIVTKKIEVQDEVQPLKISVTKEQEKSIFVNTDTAFKEIEIGLFANEDIQQKDGSTIPINTLIDTYQFNDKGQLEIVLSSPGKYYLQELKVHPNYLINNQKYEFAVNYQTPSSNITIRNNLAKYSFQVLKLDKKTNKPLINAQFSIYSDEQKENLIATSSSNASGLATFSDLEKGTYYLCEIKAPDGYVVDSKTHKIEVTDNNSLNTISIYNETTVVTGNLSNPTRSLWVILPTALLLLLRRRLS